MHYRNLYEWINIPMSFDLSELPAIAEDQLTELVNVRDPFVVGDRGR